MVVCDNAPSLLQVTIIPWPSKMYLEQWMNYANFHLPISTTFCDVPNIGIEIVPNNM
jgi:hypothetical protein